MTGPGCRPGRPKDQAATSQAGIHAQPGSRGGNRGEPQSVGTGSTGH